jgi:N-acetylneuraminic acid mutarotase
MIVWGGTDFPSGTYLNTGAVYDPSADSWTQTSTSNAPSAREQHTAVWTGSRMIIWGGVVSSAGGSGTGAAYDPVTDTWTPTSTSSAPSARWGHTAVWTGSRMVVWGGYDGGRYLDTGAAYDPITDAWTPISAANAPRGRYDPTAVWTGSRMIVWGGYDSVIPLDTGGAYDPVTDTWAPTNAVTAPGARFAHTAVWTGSRMIVWGGYDSTISPLDTGGVYDPITDTWSPTNGVNTPSARWGHTAAWTGSRMIVWGGYVGVDVDTGSAYDPLLGQSFYSVTPCRLVDTRGPDAPLGGPPLAANAPRDFVVVGHCGIPPSAQALSVNLTATGQSAPGRLQLYAGGTTPPNTSSLNYAAGQTRANNAIVKLGTLGDVGVRCVQGLGTTHIIIDVTGYFE